MARKKAEILADLKAVNGELSGVLDVLETYDDSIVDKLKKLAEEYPAAAESAKMAEELSEEVQIIAEKLLEMCESIPFEEDH